MKHRIAGLLLASLFTGSVQASGVDFRLGSRTAEFNYLTESATFGYGGADMGFGVFIDEEDSVLGTGSILVSGSSDGDVRGLQLGVGVKAYVGTLETPNDDSGGGLALGGQIRYVLPSSKPIAFVLEGWAVPEVVSVADFDGITEWRIGVELEVTPSARGYIGYRVLEVDLDVTGTEIELDDRAHVGVKFAF